MHKIDLEYAKSKLGLSAIMLDRAYKIKWCINCSSDNYKPDRACWETLTIRYYSAKGFVFDTPDIYGAKWCSLSLTVLKMDNEIWKCPNGTDDAIGKSFIEFVKRHTQPSIDVEMTNMVI